MRPPPVRLAALRGAGRPPRSPTLLRMLARLRLLLLCALAFAFAPLPAWPPAGDVRAGVEAAAPTAVERPQPTIEADRGPLDRGVRAAERAELLSTLAHVLATDGTLPRSTAGIPAPAACAAAGWSDAVQCRRWSGAHMLRWATPPPPPPPARG